MHLAELVRTSFIAATASVDQLKLTGYKALRVSTHPAHTHTPSLVTQYACTHPTHTHTITYYTVSTHARYHSLYTQDVVELFAGTSDPDFPGHLLLEQYQAQVSQNWCKHCPFLTANVISKNP